MHAKNVSNFQEAQKLQFRLEKLEGQIQDRRDEQAGLAGLPPGYGQGDGM